MSDLISRQAALDAMDTWDKFGCDPDGKLVRYDDDKHYVPYVHYEDMVHAIKHLPSAQPEKTQLSGESTTKDSTFDCISRQAAIDALGERPMVWVGGDYELGARNQYDADVLALETVPSAQPKQEQPTNIQDILEYLDTVLHPIVSPEHWNVYSELYDMISALPPAQPQSCKDAVSKADVLETYAELYDVFDDNKEIKNELHKIYDKINALQAAQPKRIKGRWELLPGRDDEHIRYLHCSVCHFNGDYESNFCPNCGADMRGVDDAAD